jgi:hypothetical protein
VQFEAPDEVNCAMLEFFDQSEVRLAAGTHG